MPRSAILVTAFEPFGGETINASWEAARRVDGWRCGDAVAHAQALPCAYTLCVAEFVAAFDRLRPRAVLMTGQAARRAMVCVERLARAGASPAARDVLGMTGPPARSGPAVRRSTVLAAEIARAIRAAGIPARVSIDPGDYVCNHLYYDALAHLAAAAPTVPAVFLHIPATPRQARGSSRSLSAPQAARALKAAIRALPGP